jgi:hypothetical protein
LSRLASPSIRDGHEGGIEHLQITQRLLEHHRFVIGFGRKEFEGSRSTASQ